MNICNYINSLYKKIIRKKKSDSYTMNPLTKKNISLDEFTPLKFLGEGKYSKIFLVKKDDKLFVLKEKKKNNTNSEILVLNTLCNKSPFIVKFYYAFQTPSYTYIVLDYLSGGDLYFHMNQRGKLPEHLVHFFAAEIGVALDFLHDNQVIFHDLKPENIMFDDKGHLHLIDLGLAEIGITQSCSGSTSECGTLQYMAPEIFNKYNYDHGFAVDWWSYGIIIYEMLTGLPPWFEDDNNDTILCILNDPIPFPNLQIDLYELSNNAKDIIRKLLNRDPEMRLGSGSSGFIDIMYHPFFEKINWIDIKTKNSTPPFVPNVNNLEDASCFELRYTSQIPEFSKSLEITV